MTSNLIDLTDHPHCLCPQGKLEWAREAKAVYSVKAGFVAVIGYDKAIDATFCTQSQAVDAVLAA